MNRYGNWLNVITPTRAIGNALGAQVSTEPGDARAFDYARELFAPGTTFQVVGDGPLRQVIPSAPAVAFYVGVSCTDEVRAACEALIAQGLPPGVIAQVGDRAALEPQWREFIEAQGYVVP